MELIKTFSGYNFWRGKDEKGYYYNVKSISDKPPTAGYRDPKFICKIKGFKNEF
jgi:hypothetical protein